MDCRLRQQASEALSDPFLQPGRKTAPKSRVRYGCILRVHKIWKAIQVATNVIPFGRRTHHQFSVTVGIGGWIKNISEAEIIVAVEDLRVAILLKEDGGNQVVCMEISGVMIWRRVV